MIKNNFKTALIKNFKDTFSEFSKNQNYIFLGRSYNWNEEPLPDVEIDSLDSELKAWDDMLVMKKILPQEVVLCTRKILWNSNVIYDQFDDIVDLNYNYNFYVLTEDLNVYKCLWNNNGAESLYAPSGTSIDLIKTADGYIWKYLYSIRPELKNFITNDYMPVDFLDRLVYESGDLRNQQLAVELDAKYNGSGKLSSVVITQVGAPYLGAIDYEPYASDIESPESLHFVQKYEEDSDRSYVTINKKISEVSSINNFYTDNYVLYISSGPGVGQVRDIISYNGTSGVIATDTKFTVVPTVNSTYKILPKIDITGDGTDAICIPIIDLETKKIKEIQVLNPGKNYHSVIAEVRTTKANYIDKTIIRAIKTSTLGHGGEAALELGCRNLMIKTQFDSKQSDKLKFFNEYRQVGIIQNPKIVNLTTEPKTILDIEAFAASQQLNITFVGACPSCPPGIPQAFTSTGAASLKGKTLIQGGAPTSTQVIGIIDSYDPKTKVMKVISLQGKYRINVSDSSAYNRLYVQDSAGVVTPYQYVRITSVIQKNNYNNNTFTPGMRVISDRTYTTGLVDSWLPNSDGLSGKLTLKNVNGKFIGTYTDIFGTLNKGEKIVNVFVDTNNLKILLTNGLTTSGIIVNELQDFGDVSTTTYRVTTSLDISRSVGTTTPFRSDTFIKDALIKQVRSLTGETIAIGRVVNWSINNDDPTSTRGTLLINTIEGKFVASTERNIFQLTDDKIYENIENTIICQVFDPEVQKYIGNMIYIDNIQPINHAPDSLEEIKLVIGF